MIGVLKSLGEYIRYENVASGEITTKVFSAVRRFVKESDGFLLELNASIFDDNVATCKLTISLLISPTSPDQSYILTLSLGGVSFF
jgi:hypothetical protein